LKEEEEVDVENVEKIDLVLFFFAFSSLSRFEPLYAFRQLSNSLDGKELFRLSLERSELDPKDEGKERREGALCVFR